MNYLVIAAHPDDEILGVGGSMAKWSKSGDKVNILIMAEGSTSRDYTRDTIAHKNKLMALKKAATEAAKTLGVVSVELIGLPDNRMDSLDLLDIVKLIENKINILKPDTVVTHHHGDLNIDHKLINQAVLTACRPQPDQNVKTIITFEVPSSTEWQSPTLNESFIPNWFVDISDTINVKMDALESYSTEMRKWPHSRSLKAVEHLARWRGATIGKKAAEAFMLVRETK